jgi:hypothetical protein
VRAREQGEDMNTSGQPLKTRYAQGRLVRAGTTSTANQAGAPILPLAEMGSATGSPHLIERYDHGAFLTSSLFARIAGTIRRGYRSQRCFEANTPGEVVSRLCGGQWHHLRFRCLRHKHLFAMSWPTEALLTARSVYQDWPISFVAHMHLK